MDTNEARNSVEAEEIQVPPGFVSRTAFILKRIASSEDVQKTKSHEFSSLEDKKLEVSLQIKNKAWIIHGQLDHHEEESDHEPSHEVPAQWDPEGASSVLLEEAPVFHPTDEEFKDTLKYIESICQQVKPYGFCRIVPPPSWQPPCILGESNAYGNFEITVQLQSINEFRNSSKRKGSTSRNIQESKRRRTSKLDSDNISGLADTTNFEVVGSPGVEQFQFQLSPHFTLESFKKNADCFKKCYFSKKSKIYEQWEPSAEDIEGEYWRILEEQTAEIEVLCGANLDAESLRTRFLESYKTDASNSFHYQDSGWNLNNLFRLPDSLLSLENSTCLGDLAPQFHIGMCFSTLPWEVQEHHLYSLHYIHLGAPKIWYGTPGHYFNKFQEAVKKHFPDITVERPELLCKLGVQVSPATLQAEGVPVYRCIQRPKEFMLFLPGAYHTAVNSGYNVSESVCFAPFEWLPHGLSVTELYRDKGIKPLISNDKVILRAAHKAVKALWEAVVKGKKTPENMTWKAACEKGSVLAKTLKVRVESEARQREFLCTMSQSRKMDIFFDEGPRKGCCICNFNLYLSAGFCPCNPNRYACLKHTKRLCSCPWSKKVFLFRFDMSELNILAGAIEGKFDAIHKWVKPELGKALEDGMENINVHVIPEDASSLDKGSVPKGETRSASIDDTKVKDPTKKLVSETMASILEATKSKCLDLWATGPGSSSDDSSSGSDDESLNLALESKGKKPLSVSLSASNGRSVGSSKAELEKREKKSSGKELETIILSSDEED